MMTIRYILLLLIVLPSSCFENKKSIDSIISYDSLVLTNGKHYYKNELYDGWVYILHENGKMAMKSEYHDGIDNGIFLAWDETGRLIEKSKTKNGHRNGKNAYISYFTNGDIKTMTDYKNGFPDGKSTEWYTNGTKRIEETYTKGKLNGKLTAWYENGNISVQGKYEYDQRVGKWRVYNINGKLIAFNYFEDDKLIKFEKIED